MIERDDYLSLGAPEYPCAIGLPFDPTKHWKLEQCRPDMTNMNLGMTKMYIDMHFQQKVAQR